MYATGELQQLGGRFYALHVPSLDDVDPEKLANAPLNFIDNAHDRTDRAAHRYPPDVSGVLAQTLAQRARTKTLRARLGCACRPPHRRFARIRENRRNGPHADHGRLQSGSAKARAPDRPPAGALHKPQTQAMGACAAALPGDARAAVEPDVRRRGTWASAPRLPLARSTDRGARTAHRARPGPCHSRRASGHVDHEAVAALIDRSSCCRWAGPDATRVACAGPAREGSRERARGQVDGAGRGDAKRSG